MWTVLVVTVLMVIAAFTVDLSQWYVAKHRAQNTADAAALAGVVFMPGQSSTALRVATETAGANGYAPAEVDARPGDRPNRLEVTVTERTGTFFAGFMGIDRLDVSRTAVAEYDQAMQVGNPSNRLGTDPEAGITNDYFLSISGPALSKDGGDRFHTTRCGKATVRCGSAFTPNNAEFDPQGYWFSVDVDVIVPGEPLRIQVYDPGHYAQQQQCDNHPNFPPGFPDSWDFSALLASGLTTMFPSDGATDAERVAHWSERYRHDPGAIYCSGDSSRNAGATTFLVYRPDGTPFSHTDNPLEPSCPPQQFDSYDEKLIALLERVGTDPRADRFAAGFRRWVDLCVVPAGSVTTGSYIVQVRLTSPPGAPLVIEPSYVKGGQNHFSLRAGFGPDIDGSGTTVFANGHLAIDANKPGSSTTMDMVRTVPGYAGRFLSLELWDVGDASRPGDLTILPPVESSTTFTNCRFANTNSVWSGDPNPADCSVPVSYNAFNGQLMTILVPLPASYDCDAASPVGCYVRVRVAYPSGSVYDHTTWSATIVGDPVRLVH